VQLIEGPNVNSYDRYVNDHPDQFFAGIADIPTIIVDKTDLLELSPESLKTILSSDYASRVASFLADGSDGNNTSSNAIARSFRSNGGKGLAGFIDSMNFDWYDKVTWDLDEKAPKMCKVTVAFSPIHDLSPGLDANGYNRAPIYPVGPYKR
jgi:hypothetical protein